MRRKIKRRNKKILKNRQREIEKRLQREQYEDQPKPIMTGSNIHYEMGEKTHAINCGGIGAIHKPVLECFYRGMVERIGLSKEI